MLPQSPRSPTIRMYTPKPHLDNVIFTPMTDPWDWHIYLQKQLPSGKLIWQWKIPFSNREYIFKRAIFHCHVGLPKGNLYSFHVGKYVYRFVPWWRIMGLYRPQLFRGWRTEAGDYNLIKPLLQWRKHGKQHHCLKSKRSVWVCVHLYLYNVWIHNV